VQSQKRPEQSGLFCASLALCSKDLDGYSLPTLKFGCRARLESVLKRWLAVEMSSYVPHEIPIDTAASRIWRLLLSYFKL